MDRVILRRIIILVLAGLVLIAAGALLNPPD